MMTPRQAAFRADYRPRISPWYNGIAHVVLIAFLGLATIAYAAIHVRERQRQRSDAVGMASRE